MSSIEIGQTVRFRVQGQRVFGVVRTAPTLTPSGNVVSVELLPDFRHLLPTGWTDAAVEELTVVKVCACAHLAYRPIWGDHKGELFTTGCDFSRMPSRTSKFLPGHDAKAKGFLIKASGLAQTLENGKGALETARELGDKISLAVAKGMDNERRRSAKAVRKTRRTSFKADPAPARREDEMDEIDKLQRKLGITDPMIRAMALGVTREHEFAGTAGGPTGTLLALQTRGLVTAVDSRLTDLGYKVMRQPTLAETDPDLVVCKDEHGAYAGHAMKWDKDEFVRECRRCGHRDEAN
ncbi:hypothetical protein SEA_GALACTICA_110 [Streptomyces phage Galactica]|nr:hypothetical protein SEA_GALACTICA_110 [Streptomyces phage Galactica]